MENENNKAESNNNSAKTGILFSLISKAFCRVLKKGYYGEISFHAVVEDGEIQDLKKQETEKYK